MAKQVIKRINLKHFEFIALNDFMRTVLKPVEGEEKVVTYIEPWSDRAVAKHMRETIPHLKDVHVLNHRLRLFGELQRTPHHEVYVQVYARQRLAAIEAWIKKFDPNFQPYVGARQQGK